MAQRDDGMDKLEAFIAGAAETRAALQRDAEKTANLSDEIEELGDRIDEEMKDLGSTVREFDARYGPIFEMEMGLMFALPLMVMGGAGDWATGKQIAHADRQALIAAADALEAEYERFPQRREEAAQAMHAAGTAAAEAQERFEEAARAMEEDVQPQAGPVMDGMDSLRQLIADNLTES